MAEGEAPGHVAVTGWVNTAAELPGARMLLDAHRDEPALRKAFAKELTALALAAGVPAYHSDLVAQGRRIQDAARESAPSTDVVDLGRASRTGLIARFRSALAA
ncbi:hypothetical protein [Aeromicrobium sp. UC242_57]|uniref:hypothetical protein n=1 Tax=Aeromicrobium sp. UC242_57 TaxID=3374624 RepID=UPI0037BD4551